MLYASLFNENLYNNPCKKGYKREYAAAMCLWCCEQHSVWKMLILQAFYLLAVSCLKSLNLDAFVAPSELRVGRPTDKNLDYSVTS